YLYGLYISHNKIKNGIELFNSIDSRQTSIYSEGDNRHDNEGRETEIVPASQSQTGNSHRRGSLFM
ncbi:MAG: hypothetical protein ABF665_19340, partial [Gluconacetobacter sp.]